MSNKSTIGLHKLQSLMANAIMRPLHNDDMQGIWIDGSPTSEYAAQFIKPNKKLTSFERLEIYNKQYWYRLLDSLQEDFAGLNAFLGHMRFDALIIAYLNRYPSHSYTLRDLGQNLPDFIREETHLTAPDSQCAYEIALLEWAEIKAFDALAITPLSTDSVKIISPTETILSTQPYLTLLELHYAIDDFLLQLNKEHNQSVESNGVSCRTIRFIKAARPKEQHIYLAVHRLNNTVYYKRLDKNQFLLLGSLMAGKTLVQACSELIDKKKDNNTRNDTGIQNQQKLISKINNSFATWMELGWFTKYGGRQNDQIHP